MNKKWLENLDLFGNEVKVYVNRNEKIHTIIGGFFSVLIFMIVIAFTWIIGYDFIFKEEPKINNETSFGDVYPKIIINKTYSPFSIQLTDNLINLPFNDDSFLKVKLEIIKLSLNTLTKAYDNISIIEIPMRPCVYTDFPNINRQKFDNLGIGTGLCPSFLNHTIKGYWIEDSLQFMRFKIFMCDYDSYSFCKRKEEIIDLIQQKNIVVNMFYQDTQISIKNYRNPINHFVSISYKNLKTDALKIIDYSLSVNSVIDNDAYFLDNRRIKEYIKLNEKQTEITDLDPNSKLLMEMNIYSSNISLITYRKYIQIPDILAFVGGIVSIFFSLFRYISLPFSDLVKYENVLNSVFDVELDKDKNYKRMTRIVMERNPIINTEKSDYNDKNKKSVLLINQPNFNNLVVSADRKISLIKRTNSDSIQDIDLQHIVEKIHHKSLNTNHYSKFFSNSEKLKAILVPICKKWYKDEKLLKRLKIFDIGKNIISSHYDLINIIKKFEELENIKKIIFSEYQKKIFDINFCSKLKLNEETKINNLEYNRDVIEDCIKTLLKKSEIDNPLIIDQNLVKILVD